MNSFKSIFLLIMLLSLSALVQASKISFSFSPTLTSGADPNGLENATWLFEFDISQPTYQLSGSFNDISFSSDSAQLTVSGATNNALNGIHAITSADISGDFVFIPDFFGSTIFALEGPNNTSSGFSFAGVNVSNFGPVGPSFGSPSVGDAVDVAPYNSFSFSSGSFTADAGTFSYTASSIPEPEVMILFLLGTGICLRLRRWKRA